MLYKEDWKEAQERWKAWWDGEVIDRPAITIVAPKVNSQEGKIAYNEGYMSSVGWDTWDFCRYPYNPEIGIRRFENWCSRMYFGGEAFPNLWINMGSGSLAAYLGCKVKFQSGTLWFEPIDDWSHLQNLKFDSENEWWVLTKRITEMAAKFGKDKFFVGVTDIGGIYDTIAMLRGPKNFVIDLFMRKDEVKELARRILEAWFICYEESVQIIGKWMNGVSAWMDLWSPKRWYPIQDDVAYYMSPKMFNEFVLPCLRELCERLDYTIYHLDGVRQIPHLDALLKIPELTGIQWVPGAGKPGCESPVWMPMYRKIQEAGKLLVLSVPYESVKHMLTHLSPRGLLLMTSCSSEREARKLLEDLTQHRF